MAPDLTILQAVEFLDVGDGVHRFHAPARALSRLSGVTVIDIDCLHRDFHRLAETADVLVMGAFNSDLFSIFEARRRNGRVTVVEANDYYPDLQPWNPLSMRWLDRSLQDSFHHALRAADGVQASVPALVERWQRRTDRPVVAFANHLEAVPPLPPLDANRPLTVGWGGSPGHFADWMAVAPVLERWLSRRPDVRLAVMSEAHLLDVTPIDPTRITFRPFGSLEAWLDFLGGLDIGVAPLLATEYNRCRSDVKLLEYASRGVAGIYRDLEPYRASVVHGQTGLLYDSDEALLACLDTLADDAALRARIRAQAHAAVARERRLDERIGERLDFYQRLGAIACGALDATLLDTGVRDGRYVRLEPGAPERALREAQRSGPSTESERALTTITRAHPAYLAAWQQLGAARNDLHAPDAALEALSSALALDPTRARTWTEMGRSHALRGDMAHALTCCERAVEVNPRYAPAWFGLTQVRQGAGGALPRDLLDEAVRCCPFNFPLALHIIAGIEAETRIAAIGETLARAACVPEEEPHAAPAFTRVFASLPPALQSRSDARALLQQLCDAFPSSHALALLRAETESAAGSPHAQALHARAAALHGAAHLFEAEQIDAPRARVWQAASHLRELRSH